MRRANELYSMQISSLLSRAGIRLWAQSESRTPWRHGGCGEACVSLVGSFARQRPPCAGYAVCQILFVPFWRFRPNLYRFAATQTLPRNKNICYNFLTLVMLPSPLSHALQSLYLCLGINNTKWFSARMLSFGSLSRTTPAS